MLLLVLAPPDYLILQGVLLHQLIHFDNHLLISLCQIYRVEHRLWHGLKQLFKLGELAIFFIFDLVGAWR